MKRIIIIACILSLLFASCSVTKRDCRGVKHYKQSGGFYLLLTLLTTLLNTQTKNNEAGNK